VAEQVELHFRIAVENSLIVRNRVGADEFGDYKSNIALYPRWQEYLRATRPPVLAVWGNGDTFFAPAGAHAFRNDVPDAEIHLFDT
ncbi:alpha/beta fold hydrolase, partial [Rhizobium leguminosarum]|uniref:alpha/beta fold hydrolase n=1 Tax=Rhizobium leguminosarum TaxID=384 RepID=UPI003F95EFA3